jgi:hypothetical protein
MSKFIANAGLAAIIFTLSACGGSNDGVAVTPPPAPPPPPPPATYVKIDDLTGTQVFQTATIKYNVVAGVRQNYESQNFGAGSTITYNATNDSFIITPVGGAAVTFTQANLDPATTIPPGQLGFINGTSRLFYITPGAATGVPLSYTRLGSFNTVAANGSINVELLVGGVPTIRSDLPTTGTANYTTGIGGTANLGGTNYSLANNSTATFSANFATGAINLGFALGGKINPTAPRVDLGTATGTGTISSATSGFSGLFTSGTNVTSGLFTGSFFGPQAAEIGFNFQLAGPNFSAVGQGAGVKVVPTP